MLMMLLLRHRRRRRRRRLRGCRRGDARVACIGHAQPRLVHCGAVVGVGANVALHADDAHGRVRGEPPTLAAALEHQVPDHDGEAVPRRPRGRGRVEDARLVPSVVTVNSESSSIVSVVRPLECHEGTALARSVKSP